MRLFTLDRSEDATGTSGIGVVAQGVEFDDGIVVLRWTTPLAPHSTCVYDNIDELITIHGHDGRTLVQYL